ncbi:hypothetical protein TrLO_g13130 [Triparma laevis f. longispina]|uniref:SET domain-containing protein n=1 Tax=Triparma laevis f. longispina TaxID=1714387 RepID=A0A9W7KTR2_9STRA|nr:hypothetical protein TrLO_g13130 [Triparma laevis f. longispina]
MEFSFEMQSNDTSGRGLYATKCIPSGTLIHTAPCLLFPSSTYTNHARHTVLEHYLFNCPNGDRLLALGYGSIFNHDETPNVDFRVDRENLEVRYIACKEIDVGCELFIYYGDKLWFEYAGKKEESSDEEGDFLARIEL